MKPGYDLAVAYRIYPRVSKTPLVFADDKLKLAELCLRSFASALGPLRAKVFVLLDNCPPSYGDIVRSAFDADDLELINLPGLGNRASFGRQLNILSGQRDSDLVYFAEDDYFYLPDQLASMVSLIRSRGDVDFVTPYDHRDYYTEPWHRTDSALIRSEGRGWRRVGSTTLTFMTSKLVLSKTRSMFQTYVDGRKTPDFAIWHSLTKRGIGPTTLIRTLSRPSAIVVLGATWFYGWRQVLFGRRWALWAPSPTIGVHLDKGFLPPDDNWRPYLASAMRDMLG